MTLAQPVVEASTEYATRRARPQTSRTNLRVVLPLRPARASRGVFALFVTALLALGLLAMLVINTSLAQGAFALSELKSQLSSLNDQEAMLREQVAGYGAPERLEARARDLGMVPAEAAAFLDARDGSVVGNTRPTGGVAGGVLPRLRVPVAAIPSAAVPSAEVAAPAPGSVVIAVPAGSTPAEGVSVDASLDLGTPAATGSEAPAVAGGERR